MDWFIRAGLGNAATAALLAVGAGLLGRGLGRHPALRHGLWLLVLVKLLTPPLFVVPVRRSAAAPPPAPEMALVFEGIGEALQDGELLYPPSGLEVSARPPGAAAAGEPALGGWARLWAAAGAAWMPAIAGVWTLGSVVMLGVAALRIGRWRRLMRFLEPAPEEVQDRVEELAAMIGLGRPPTAWWFDGPVAPMLWAVGCRPRLIVPAPLWDRLDKGQRTTLLLHELAHLKRGDHWIRIVELLATALFWWLPVAWIARRQLREAEEQCCDAWVVWACPDAARTYAEALLDTVDFLSENGRSVPLAASGFGYVHHLKRRVTMIMQGTTPRALSWTGLLAMFGLSALCLPLSPTWARADDEPERKLERSFIVIQGEGDEAVVKEKTPRTLQYDYDVTFTKNVADDEDAEAAEHKAREKKRAKDKEKDKDKDEQSIVAQKQKLEELRNAIMQKMDAELKKFGGDNAQAKEAAERAHRKLEESLSKIVEDKQFRFIYRSTDGAKEPAEQKKRIAEATARVEKARAQLREAEAQLAKLRGAGFMTARLVPPRPPMPPKPFVARDMPGGKPQVLFRTPASDRRIDELERKLDRLVDEMKHLREERERRK